ncbi:MAG TPA: beta-glucosidase BglX [Gemmatimonadaceae bacterium]|nr:beta-glucosidase BglX [Gemmatimonadaceae bacterium]
MIASIGLVGLAAGCAPAGSAVVPEPGAAMPAGASSAEGAREGISAGSALPNGATRPAAIQGVDPRMEPLVDSVLALMTIEEKVGQLTQSSASEVSTGPRVSAADRADIRAGKVGSFLGSYGAERTRELQRVAVEESRLGIPLLFAHDVIHGFRTIFPVPLAEAASFDPDAVERAARIAATEAAANGVQWTFAPMVDIARDPRWGRIVEGSGEDPYLGSVMAAAKVRGFQGTDLADTLTILATAKHFVAYGAAEGGRDYNTAEVSERTLREIYLPPFHAAVRAGAGSVMAGFDDLDGVPMHSNERLIDGLLRGEWGWDGILVSDYTGVMELIKHRVAADSTSAALLAINAGVDVDMMSGIYLHEIPRLVSEHQLSEAVVDSAVRRVLRAKYRLGLYRDPYRYSSAAREKALTLTPAHRAVARQLARESIVLLRNEGHVLPLRKDIGVLAVIGPLADDSASALGSWSAAGRPEDAVTVADGLRRAVTPDTRILRARGTSIDGSDTSGIAEAVRVARQADAVVMVLGEERDMSGEARDRAFIGLPGEQLRLAKAVQATGKPVVVVLINGRPLATPWLAEHVPAIVESWYLGVEMGGAVADVLFGDYNPGGKLPVTVPRAVGQVPIYYNHKSTGRPPSQSDRYTSKYIDIPWTPLYPFGYGASYTTFEYGEPRLSATEIRPSDSLVVTVGVTNSGSREGDEVVQLYVRDDAASVTRPVKELRGFRRIALQPGETRMVNFTITANDLAFHDRAMRRVVEPGTFTVYVGTSSDSTREVHFRVLGDVTAVPDTGTSR